MLPDNRFQKPEKWRWVRFVVPLAALTLLSFGMAKWFEWQPAFLRPSLNVLYRYGNGTWQRLPELPGDPRQVQVSAGGTVWVLFWRYGVGTEFARLDGPSWRIYQAADFGTKNAYPLAGFVLDGEEVWAAMDEGVLHWDGRHWKRHREAIKNQRACSLVAANGDAWMIDPMGNMSHFDGRQWKVEKVELPGVKWGANEWDAPPELARTMDGSLWIVREGVWRLDGSKWVPIKSGGRDFKAAELIGATSKSIWLWDGEHLDSVGPGGTQEEFGTKELGLRQEEAVSAVAEAGDSRYVAASGGILEYRGGAWRRLAPPPDGVKWVVSVHASADGELFVIGDIPNPGARRWRFLKPAAPLLILLGYLAVLVWMVRDFKRRRLSEHVRLGQAVEHATGAAPAEFARDERVLRKQSSWWSAIGAVFVIVGAMVAYSITRVFWRAEPPWMFLVIALGLHILLTMGQSLVRRTPKPWDPIEPGGPRFDWGPTRRALPGALAVFILLNLGEVEKWTGNPVLWLLCGFWAVMLYRFCEALFVNSAARRGNYEGATKLLGRFHFYNPEGVPAQAIRGNLLLMQGRFREAEEVLRRALAGPRSRMWQAVALEYLGDALLEQGRYDEAMRSYEAAAHALPGYRRPYRGMAELILRQGRDPVRALEYVERIAGPSGPSRSRFRLRRQPLDDYWALKAWALAQLGRGAEVARVIAEAIRRTNPKSRPDLASTYRRLGLAMRALEREAEAEEYLKTARDADPQGRWSKLARAALGEKRVWRE